MKDDRHGNRLEAYRPDPNPPTVRKIRADSVPYGDSISRNGRTVWVVLEEERVVCVAATAAEVRRKYREHKHNVINGIGGPSKC
jgi:hypothetical protein